MPKTPNKYSARSASDFVQHQSSALKIKCGYLIKSNDNNERLKQTKGSIMIKYFSIVALAIVLSGCATTDGYKQVVNSWVGSPEINLIRSWGPPQQSYQSGDSKFLVYHSARNVYLPGTPPTYSTTVIGNTAYTNSYGGTPAQNLNYRCQTTFEVRNGVIASWSFKGNDCMAKPNQ
jgi:hypothetical protein